MSCSVSLGGVQVAIDKSPQNFYSHAPSLSTWGLSCPVGAATIWLLGISSNFEIWGFFLMLESSFAFKCDHFFRKYANAFIF